MGKLYDKAIKLIVTELDNDANAVLKECVEEREYKHRTYNLYDSYGYGIYVNGRLEKIGYLSASPKANKGKFWYGEELHGRQEINDYLKSDYKASGLIDLAVVATMPYAKVLEDGGGGITHKYRVISMSFQKLKELSYKYNGVVKMIRQ